MAKSTGSSPVDEKKKVTPVQIAFLVDRYLADNSYAAALAAFRSEAADLFSKTKGKDVPKGLLSLGDILDDYIRLKEQKVMVDQEKRRVEALLQGIQDAVSAYHHQPGGGSPLGVGPTASPPPHAPPVLPPPAPMTTTPMTLPRFQVNSANNVASPAGHIIQNMPVMKSMYTMVQYHSQETSNFSTPNAISFSRRKRKTSKQVPRAPPPPKKPCSASDAPFIRGIKLPSQVNAGSNTEVAEELSLPDSRTFNQPIGNSTVLGSSVAKSLFKQQPESQANLSSPKTPPQPSPTQSGESASPSELPFHSECTTGNTSVENTPSKRSLISSKKIIMISPLKHSACYSMERSHHISSSPSNSSPSKLGKRDHVKSRLDFDSEVSLSSDRFVEVQTSTSSNDEKLADDFLDMALPNLDEDFSFSQLLVDFDIDSAGMELPCEPASNDASDFIRWSADCEIKNALQETNQVSSNLQSITEVLSEKEINFHDPVSMNSLRVETKCITIVSPVKNRGSPAQD